MERAAARTDWLGLGAVALAVAIWAGWIVLVRGSVGAALNPFDIAALRYGAPAALLAPVLWRSGLLPRGVAPWRMAAMTLGWGAPFAVFAAEGLRDGTTALFAALVPGSLPLWVAAISAVTIGVRLSRRARLGLALIALGAALALIRAAWAGEGAALAGAPWLIGASIAWATYTLAYRGSGLTPLEATAAVAFWSCVMLAPAVPLGWLSLGALTPAALATQLVLHGVVSGVISVFAFAVAIRRLGAQRAAAFSALVPVLASLGGVAILDEPAAPDVALAVGAASLGVWLVNTARP